MTSTSGVPNNDRLTGSWEPMMRDASAGTAASTGGGAHAIAIWTGVSVSGVCAAAPDATSAQAAASTTKRGEAIRSS